MTTGAIAGLRFNSLAHLPLDLKTRLAHTFSRCRDNRLGFGNGRENPRPVFVVPPPATLGTGNHRHASHATQLASPIKPI